MLKFDWDEAKNQANIRKHGISFQEAITVFYDDDALIIQDDAHSELEERFILIGFSYKANILVVCHCYREQDSIIRIISARKASTKERKSYINSYEK